MANVTVENEENEKHDLRLKIPVGIYLFEIPVYLTAVVSAASRFAALCGS